MDGRQRVDPALDDLLNLKKMAAARVDLAIVDPEVFDYLAVLVRECVSAAGRAHDCRPNSTYLGRLSPSIRARSRKCG